MSYCLRASAATRRRTSRYRSTPPFASLMVPPLTMPRVVVPAVTTPGCSPRWCSTPTSRTCTPAGRWHRCWMRSGTVEGCRLRWTCHPRHGSGCRHPRLAAARRDGGRVKRSRRLCYFAKSPTLLTPEEASSLDVEPHPAMKKATNNQLLVAFVFLLQVLESYLEINSVVL